MGGDTNLRDLLCRDGGPDGVGSPLFWLGMMIEACEGLPAEVIDQETDGDPGAWRTMVLEVRDLHRALKAATGLDDEEVA